MAKKIKPKRVVIGPKTPDSFSRADLLKAIDKFKAARLARQKPPVADGSK